MASGHHSQEGNCGRFQFVSDFPSEFVRSRNIILWLPPGYDQETKQSYPVLYAHDGQNLFDPRTSYIGVDWGLHETLGRLIAAGTVRKALAVGIWNTPDRYREFDPQEVFERNMSGEEQAAYAREFGRPIGDRYLKFIVRELKPFIDQNYRTLSARDDTLLLGSSMGGIISAYAMCEYPEVFGAAACLSTHWPTVNGKMIDFLAARLPEPKHHRLYFDFGTETIDSQYEPFQQQVDEVLRRKGYREGHDWVTRKFTGEEHSERAWRRRLDIPLRFLLG